MFNVWLQNFGVLLHQIWLYMSIGIQNINMFLGRSESIKWIRKKLSHHVPDKSKQMKVKQRHQLNMKKKVENIFWKNCNSNNSINNNNNDNNESQSNSNKHKNNNNNNNNNNVRDLNEILIVSSGLNFDCKSLNNKTNNNNKKTIKTISHGIPNSFTPPPITGDDSGNKRSLKMSNNYVNEVRPITGNHTQNAPIAQAELTELDGEQKQQEQQQQEQHYYNLHRYCRCRYNDHCCHPTTNTTIITHINDNDNDNNEGTKASTSVQLGVNNNKNPNVNNNNSNNVKWYNVPTTTKITPTPLKVKAITNSYGTTSTWPIANNDTLDTLGNAANDCNVGNVGDCFVDINVNDGNSKSSRVRKYWRKCRDLWLLVGSNNQLADNKLKCVAIETPRRAAQKQTSTTARTTNCFINLLNNSHSVTKTITANHDDDTTDNNIDENDDDDGKNFHKLNAFGAELDELYDDAADAGSYGDIDFGIHSLITASAVTPTKADKIDRIAKSISTSILTPTQIPTTTKSLMSTTPKPTQEINEILLNKSINFLMENYDDNVNNKENNDNSVNPEEQFPDIELKKTQSEERKKEQERDQEQHLVESLTSIQTLTVKKNNTEIFTGKLRHNNNHNLEYYELATLIDRYLGNIYPVYLPLTRTVLIREARNVLINIYHGCLDNFERLFLCKCSKIASILQKRHHIGEALLWCQGWPLVTPSGAVILHLGGLEDDQVKPADIYLCVKTASIEAEPQLYAVWRSPSNLLIDTEIAKKTRTLSVKNLTSTSTATSTLTLCKLKSKSLNSITAAATESKEYESFVLASELLMLKCYQFDYQDHTQYLSMWALEMLNEELPQLLQNLLVGVEKSVERLMLNELQPLPPPLCAVSLSTSMAPKSSAYEQIDSIACNTTSTSLSSSLEASKSSSMAFATCHSYNGSSSSSSRHNNNNINNVNANVNVMPLRLDGGVAHGSPKCLLKRSELITKNKLHSANSKYFLRRLTNRQDSMNSTSSGNSSASGLSTTSSDSGSYGRNHHNHHHPFKQQQLQIEQKQQQQLQNPQHKSKQQEQQQQPYKLCDEDYEKPTKIGTTLSEPNSPALPRFCLGNTFPHIDSDEDSVHDHFVHNHKDHHNDTDNDNDTNDNDHYKTFNNNHQHSLQHRNDHLDHLESEILSIDSIADIPEKLLLSGINLPGAHDLRGYPLITIDAETVCLNDLKCSEVATLLLLYINITESSCKSCLNDNMIDSTSFQRIQQIQQQQPLQQPQKQQQTSSSSSSTTTATVAPTFNGKFIKSYQCQEQQQPQQISSLPSLVLPSSPQPLAFTILIMVEHSQHLCVIDLIIQSLKLLKKHHVVGMSTEILVACNGKANYLGAYSKIKLTDEKRSQREESTDENEQGKQHQAATSVSNLTAITIPNTTTAKVHELDANYYSECDKLKFISVDEVTMYIAPQQYQQQQEQHQTPPIGHLKGLWYHDARKWRDFFIQYEPFYQQCTGAAQRLLIAMNDIRYADLQGLATRRQLYAQHRALSRVLMDPELNSLRKRGSAILARLHELSNSINRLPLTTIIPTQKSTTMTTQIISTVTSDRFMSSTINSNNSNNSISRRSRSSADNSDVGDRDSVSKSVCTIDVTTAASIPLVNTDYHKGSSNSTKDHLGSNVMPGNKFGCNSNSYNSYNNSVISEYDATNVNATIATTINTTTTTTTTNTSITSSSTLTTSPLYLTLLTTTRVATNLNNDLNNSEIISLNSTRYSSINSSSSSSNIKNSQTNNDNNNNNNNNNSFNTKTITATKNSINSSDIAPSAGNIDVAIRLQKITLLFNEIDRAAKRLEQLTEQRREHLRELTRQRALEDEINEVTAWLNNDGNETLQRFINFHLSWDMPLKEREQEFEQFYFISMKHLAKGRDLYIAAKNIKTLQESALNLKMALDCFSEKLEMARERMEATLRLHGLLNNQKRDDTEELEMIRLAEEYAVKGVIDKYREQMLLQPSGNNIRWNGVNASQHVPLITQKSVPTNLTAAITTTIITTTTPTTTTGGSTATVTDCTFKKPETTCNYPANYFGGYYETSFGCRGVDVLRSASDIATGRGARECDFWHDSRNLDDIDLIEGEEDEEGQSKIADSGLGGCHHCDDHTKLTHLCSCSCQSLNETQHLYDKHDELDDECFDQSGKRFLDIRSPLEANKHLQGFATTFELPESEELSCLEPKIQKTILLIMREMIGTERDYVRSLYYVIENYVDELLRDDIPQPLRGQRNVIFGNIEKIFEFHNNHFLRELERYESNPLKVGAAFLQMESKFYLYALYNKNKPKSDTLMSEYGTSFFKSKQRELGDKLDLASYLLKPVQRMGKYALLLQQLVKACSTVQGKALQEISADVEELRKAEEMVKFQLRHGNDLLAMDSLRDCDVNVKEQGRLLRQNEFLVWQGKGGKKSLRQVFLFEELVLFSKARRFPDNKNLDIYIYKNSIKTSDIGLTAHIGESLTKFEIWFRKRKPDDTYTLQCMSEDIKNAWTDEISKLLWQQAKRNREIRLAEMSSMGIGSKPCLDIRPSNNQINDRSITITQLTKAPKLRHSFVGLQSDQIKNNRRPNSLISESSVSSGTSTSSLSKSSNASSTAAPYNHHHHSTGLELINESQTLMLNNDFDQGNSQSFDNVHDYVRIYNNSNDNHSTLSADVAKSLRQQEHLYKQQQQQQQRCQQQHNHRRSTTVTSQLSMESGIISDLCLTSEQECNDINANINQTDGHANEFLTNFFNNNYDRNISIKPNPTTISATIITTTTISTAPTTSAATMTATTQSTYQSSLRCHNNNNYNNNHNTNNNNNSNNYISTNNNNNKSNTDKNNFKNNCLSNHLFSK